MLELSTETRVTELEADHPATLATLKSTGIFHDGDDADVTVGDLCMNVGLHPQIILSMLQRAQLSEAPSDIDISELDGLSLTEIVKHIESVHHTSLRKTLPVIVELVRQVAAAYGDGDERLYKLQALFEKMAVDLEDHMLHEEEALFPMCRSMVENGEIKATRCGDRVGGPIQCMKNDHDQVKQELAQLSELTDGFTQPAGADKQYHEMLEQLKHFGQDTVLHIHKEDHLLFPRALETQAALREST
jgi:regulator of cell morphogenesis and NO signaling